MVVDGKLTSGYIQIQKTPNLTADDEAIAFWERIKKLRSKFL